MTAIAHRPLEEDMAWYALDGLWNQFLSGKEEK
jgi:hypothetical protein